MNEIVYERAGSVDEALRLARAPGAAFIAGGTNLIDLMKGGIAAPERLVDVSRLALATVSERAGGGVRIGALCRNSDLAEHRLIRERYPLLSQALLAGASPQLRNMATVGGNLLQRTRCYYFYDPAFVACNKRNPGSGCAARDGFNRIHAILGASPACVAVNPSDMNVALTALRGEVIVQGRGGERRMPIGDFHRLPGDTPQRDANLEPGELITAVDLPPSPFASASFYLKVRDRASYAFALVSVACGLELQDSVVRDAAIALGGVAHKPWRVAAAEQSLLGKPLDDASIARACELLLEGARPLEHNGFKVELARRSIGRALRSAAAASGRSV